MSGSQARTTLTASDDALIIGRTQDVEPIIDDVKARRDGGLVGSGDMRHVCRVPTVLLEAACNEAGVDMSDRDAVREIIYKKVISGDWAKFQVHAGGF